MLTKGKWWFEISVPSSGLIDRSSRMMAWWSAFGGVVGWKAHDICKHICLSCQLNLTGSVCTYQNHRARHGIRNISGGILGFFCHTTESVTFPTDYDKSLLSRSVLIISIEPDLREMTHNTTSNSRILPSQHVNVGL
jgi:hypothetical protein